MTENEKLEYLIISTDAVVVSIVSGPRVVMTYRGYAPVVEVEVEGELRNGMVIDFEDLKAVLKEIVAKFDHRLINEIIENPTCENICLAIFNEIKSRLKDLRVVRVKVYENPDKWAEIRS